MSAQKTKLAELIKERVSYLHIFLVLDDGKHVYDGGPRNWKPTRFRRMRPHLRRTPLEQQISDMVALRAADSEEHRSEIGRIQMDLQSMKEHMLDLLADRPPPRANAALLALELPPQQPVQLPLPPSPVAAAPAASSTPPPVARNATAMVATPPVLLDSPARSTRGALRRAYAAGCAVRRHTAMAEPICPICRDGWEEKELYVFFVCGHRICGVCSGQDEHLLCPVCRGPTGPPEEWKWGEC